MRDEAKFQRKLIERLEKEFPGSIVMKNDPSYIQAIPDLTMLYKDKWVALECKASWVSDKQPNQDWYIETMNEMGGYAYVIFPENMEEVIDDIKLKLGAQ